MWWWGGVGETIGPVGMRARRSGFSASRRVLIYLSSSPSGTEVVRATTGVTGILRTEFATVCIRASAIVGSRSRSQLSRGVRLTRELNTRVIVARNRGMTLRVSRCIELSSIAGVIVKRDDTEHEKLFKEPALARGLVSSTPGISVRVVPSTLGCAGSREHHLFFNTRVPSLQSVTIAILTLTMYATVKFLFSRLSFPSAGVIAMCVLNILVVSILAGKCLYDVTNSLLDITLFKFFLARPELSFRACTMNCPIAFTIVLTSSILANALTSGLGSRTELSTHSTFHIRILFSASHLLRGTGDGSSILDIAYVRLSQLLSHDVITCAGNRGKVLSKQLCTRGGSARTRGLLDSTRQRATR